MGFHLTGFKVFMEKVSLGSPSMKKRNKPENYLDVMWRELGIDPNTLPDLFQTGPVELEDEGLWFNTAIWKLDKPVDIEDPFVKIYFHKSLSPSLNQGVYKKENGKMVPYVGNELPNRPFMITPGKLAKMLGIGWTPAIQGAGGGLGGIL